VKETFNNYEGKALRLKYPGLLKIKSEEPWWALARGNKASVMIELNPIESKATAFSRMIRSPHFTKTPDALIEREGEFATDMGIRGHERVSRMLETMAWNIDGKFQDRDVLIIQIWTHHNEWQDGKIWRELLDSIEIVG
jgi:hypothetical protein